MKKDKSHIDNKLTFFFFSFCPFPPLLRERPSPIYLLLFLKMMVHEKGRPRRLYEIVCRKLCVRDLHYHFFSSPSNLPPTPQKEKKVILKNMTQERGG